MHRIVVQRGSEMRRGMRLPTYAFTVDNHEGRSHQPFLDGCRVLLAGGTDPDDTAVMVWSDGVESLRGPVGMAAGLAVGEDHDGTLRFRRYQEFAHQRLDASDEG